MERITAIEELPQEYIPTDIDSKKEAIFDITIIHEIISAFTDDLFEVGFEEDQVQDFKKELSNLEENEIKAILSMPRELRLRNFPKYFSDVDSGNKTIQKIVSDLAQNATKHGFTLGYHVSNNEILPEGDEWMIRGYEFDDRDERAMAYYSLDYKNLFRVDRGRYLYIVRAEVGGQTDHKRDTSNNWGRAATLSVVHKLNTADIDERVEKILHEEKNNEKGTS